MVFLGCGFGRRCGLSLLNALSQADCWMLLFGWGVTWAEIAGTLQFAGTRQFRQIAGSRQIAEIAGARQTAASY